MQFRKSVLSSRIAFVLMAGFLSAGHAAESASGQQATADEDYSLLDWVPRDQLTESQAAGLPPYCCGMFVEPAGIAEGQDPADSLTEIETLQNIVQPEPGRTQIDGPVTIRQGYRSLEATEQTEINNNDDTVTLRGGVIFREPGVLLRGDSALLDQTSERNTVNDASYVLYENNIHGQAIRIIHSSADGSVIIDNGEFSRCEPGNEFWLLRARSIELRPEEGIGYATAAQLRIKDFPVFYYPFTLQFPLGDERVSGFLVPTVSNSSDDGLDVAVPYYLNLAPHYDATLTPRIITERGPMISAEMRYLASSSMNTMNLALMPDDRFYDEALAGIPGSGSPPDESRWFMGFEHHGTLGANWSTLIDYSAVSDHDYFRDLGSSGLEVESRTHLNKLGQINFQNANWRAGTRVQRIEVIDPLAATIDINKPYDRLPELTLGGDFELDSGIQYGFQAAHVRFDRHLDRSMLGPAQIMNGALVTGQRFNMEPSISWPLRTAGSFLIPTAKYRYASWELDDQAVGTSSSPSVGVGVFSLDGGLIFERPFTFAGGSFTQTLEPRLFYLYSEFEEQEHLPNFDSSQLNFSFNQVFRDNRFSGGDRFGDANQISAAITSRLLDGQGRERAWISVGQIFHLKDRRVSLDSPLQSWQVLQPLDDSRSALVAEASYNVSPDWQVRSDLQWDTHRQNIDEGSIALHYQSDLNHIVNLAYRYRENVDIFLPSPPEIDPRIKQTDISAVWPLNDSWRLLGRWNYDHSNSRNLETFAGVEYSNCCAAIRLVAREWIDQYEYLLLRNKPNRGIFFQLSLTGLGNVTGGGISRLLSDGIPGFKEYENQ